MGRTWGDTAGRKERERVGSAFVAAAPVVHAAPEGVGGTAGRVSVVVDVLPRTEGADGGAEHDDEAQDADEPAELHAGDKGGEPDEEDDTGEGGTAAVEGAPVGSAQRVGELGILRCEGGLEL